MIILVWQIFIKHFLNAGPVRNPKEHSSEIHSNGMGGTRKALRDCWSLCSRPAHTAPRLRSYELCLGEAPGKAYGKQWRKISPHSEGPLAQGSETCARE